MHRLSSVVVVMASATALWSSHAQAQTAQPAAKPPAAPAAEAAPAKKAEERLSDEAELARVAGLYEAGQYRECERTVERLLDPLGKAPPLRNAAIVENARVYWAACLLGAGESDAADAPLRAAIHENPQMKAPDSLVFPQPVVQRFLKVRDSLVNEIRAAEQARIRQAQAAARQREQKLARDRERMQLLEQLASEQEVVVKNRRVLAMVPFGVGQIQNRQETLGYALMASQLALGSLSLVAIAVQSRFAAQVDDLSNSGDTVQEEDYTSKQRTWSVLKTASAWSFVALAVGGVVHAQIEFVPEFRETRKRPLPPSVTSALPQPRLLSAAPYAEPSGGGLSFTGCF